MSIKIEDIPNRCSDSRDGWFFDQANHEYLFFKDGEAVRIVNGRAERFLDGNAEWHHISGPAEREYDKPFVWTGTNFVRQKGSRMIYKGYYFKGERCSKEEFDEIPEVAVEKARLLVQTKMNNLFEVKDESV